MSARLPCAPENIYRAFDLQSFYSERMRAAPPAGVFGRQAFTPEYESLHFLGRPGGKEVFGEKSGRRDKYVHE